MSLLSTNELKADQYTWLQRIACNIIHYGCTNQPRHIAIVMDGNRRFAQQHSFEREQGHSLGANKLFDVCQWCYDIGINELSVYAFSLENLKRSQDEINTLMDIARSKLDEIKNSIEKIHEQKICIRVVGNLDLLPEDIKQSSCFLMNETESYKNFVLNVYLYYTSRYEITNVIKDISKACEKDLIRTEDIDDDLIMKTLIISTSHTGRLPDIFLRTSGELRLSDFLLLQCRFSLWIFADVYWPAFSIWHLYWAILQHEMMSKRLNNVQKKCEAIIKANKNDDEAKLERIKTYFEWLQQAKLNVESNN